jgi:hypothetical protein
VDPRVGLDDVQKRKFSTLPGLELQLLGRPARSQSLYRLHYPSSPFEKAILKIFQRHIEERYLLNASQFGSRAQHSTTFQCMRLTDLVTLYFNNNMSTAAVFLDIEKAFDTTWHLGLLYKLFKLKFWISQNKLLALFFLRVN